MMKSIHFLYIMGLYCFIVEAARLNLINFSDFWLKRSQIICNVSCKLCQKSFIGLSHIFFNTSYGRECVRQFHPSLIFRSRAGAYPSRALKLLHSKGKPLSALQI
jgi:hypothetical protein